jgi:uroporphyrin-III C-methyltransferase
MIPGSTLSTVIDALPRFRPGHVWLVGAGPGDPGLLTLAAVSAIAQADVIVHDALIGEQVLALAGPEARVEPVGKRGGLPSARQADISVRLIELARKGERVLRLKGGDPFVFARGGEEIFALAEAAIPFRVIAGVTAGLAGLVAATIPTTLRGVNQAIILATGHSAEQAGSPDWEALARTKQPLVLYMAMNNLRSIATALGAGGLAPETPAAIIVSATMAEERILVTTLAQLADAADTGGFASPAIVVIGEIVAAREKLAAAAGEIEQRWHAR